ncbi:MAG: HlyD family type I secretion periplasmic adaptor subunit [Legionellales bacterium]|nr:HlyD family type I secretion periplasmic adaptor subunit [Legionellales bacterium]
MNKEKKLSDDITIGTLKGPSTSSHYILWGALAFILIGLIWANFAILDEISRGEGKVIPSSQVQVIQNLEGGIIKNILVSEGEIVEKNQILMVIDDTQFTSSLKESEVRVKALQAKITRLVSETRNVPLQFSYALEKNYPDIVKNEKALYSSRQRELETRLSTLKSQVDQKNSSLKELISKKYKLTRSYELIKQELDLTEPLLIDGAVSKVEVIRLKRQANDLSGEIEETKISINRSQLSVEEAKSKMHEIAVGFRSASLDELNRTRAELAPLVEGSAALEDRVKRTQVKSPVRGTVKQIFINTIGGVITPGMDLLEIVPLNDTLLVEAYIKPSDIAFIHPGQDAIVKITAYDFAIYGGLPGNVEHISADTVKPEGQEQEEGADGGHSRQIGQRCEKAVGRARRRR